MLIAAGALAALDSLVLVASFVSEPPLGGWLLAVGLALALLGPVLRRMWPVLAAQNGIILLSSAHAIRGEGVPEASSLFYFAGLLLLGNLLAWPLARYVARR
ncbi:hypothetical protein ACBY01_13495 [Sphingomonas sp. ac-8]|uniref:hypothetical protein n=1 Tax=Sphingomonas sp. ac-8 TaxID=3242977 RepID=UPI003A80B423